MALRLQSQELQRLDDAALARALQEEANPVAATSSAARSTTSSTDQATIAALRAAFTHDKVSINARGEGNPATFSRVLLEGLSEDQQGAINALQTKWQNAQGWQAVNPLVRTIGRALRNLAA